MFNAFHVRFGRFWNGLVSVVPGVAARHVCFFFFLFWKGDMLVTASAERRVVSLASGAFRVLKL